MCSSDLLREEIPLPCIIHWNQKHFVVVYKIKKNKIYISDPASGLLVYDKNKFLKSWIQINDENHQNGIALILETTPDFYNEKGDEDKKLKFSQLLHYLKPYKSYLIQLAIAMLTASILSLIPPFLTQSVVDQGIGTNNLSLVTTILIAQVVLVFGQMANNLIRSWLMLHMTTRISISLISNFLSKLMRLPISFFDSKKAVNYPLFGTFCGDTIPAPFVSASHFLTVHFFTDGSVAFSAFYATYSAVYSMTAFYSA